MTRDVTVWSPVERGCWSWVLLAGLTLSRQEAQTLLSWLHRCWNKRFSGRRTCISYFAFFLEVAITCTPCWPFSIESRLIKIQFNYYMQIKEQEWKTDSSVSCGSCSVQLTFVVFTSSVPGQSCMIWLCNDLIHTGVTGTSGVLVFGWSDSCQEG